MFRKLLRLMLEYRSGPIETLKEALIPMQTDITLSETAYGAESHAEQNPAPGLIYKGPVETCTGCGGTREDSSRYEPLFDIYAPCSMCHGEGVVPLKDSTPGGAR